jgi:hypothetical protein
MKPELYPNVYQMLTPIPNLGSVTWFFYISALTEVNKLDTWLLEDFVNILLLDIVNVVDNTLPDC